MFEYDNNFREQGDSVIFRVPGRLAKQELFTWYNESLKFPYFGFNWDSLYDVLCDLAWIKEKYISIIHCDLPNLSESELVVYANILFDAISNWNFDDKHILCVYFPVAEKVKLDEYTKRFQKNG